MDAAARRPALSARMPGRPSVGRMPRGGIALGLLAALFLLAHTVLPAFAGTGAGTGKAWELAVVGRIDACWVCQHGPAPHVRYSRILAGPPSTPAAPGRLPLVEVAAHLLKPGGIPLYRSEAEEICLLKRAAAGGGTAAYRVVDVLPATAENIAAYTQR